MKEKFEIEDPKQVIDYLGMMGDSVDNIPGLPGVGDKTAKKFLKQYGSLENLLDNTHELKGKMKEKVEASKELGLLSKELATIMLDCPVEFHEEDFELNSPDLEKVTEIFQELEFRRALDNLNRIFDQNPNYKGLQDGSTDEKPVSANGFGEQLDIFSAAANEKNVSAHSGYQNIENTDHFYQSVETELARKMLLGKLMQQSSVCFDTETTSLKTLEAKLVGIAFSYSKGKGYYLPIPEKENEAFAILEEFRPFFDHEGIEKIGQNLKYDIKVLQNYDIQVKGCLLYTSDAADDVSTV